MLEDRRILRIKIKPFFKWYDLWIGAYIDRHNQAVYLCFLTLGLKVTWWIETNDRRSYMRGWKDALDHLKVKHLEFGQDFITSFEETRSLNDYDK